MAIEATATEHVPADDAAGVALQHGHWRRPRGLSSVPETLERFLGASGFDRGPWLAVGFAGGIAAWFALDDAWQWLGLLGVCLIAIGVAGAMARGTARFPFVAQAMFAMAIMVAAGCAVVWIKSTLVGTPPIARPLVTTIEGRVLAREDRPAEGKARLVLAFREPEARRVIRARVNVPARYDAPDAAKGALVRLRVRLMPPAPPMLPGGYDFARTAWFQGLSATGGAIGPVQVIDGGRGGGWQPRAQAFLSRHVRERLAGSSGTIAAALASGDRGAIAPRDDQAMRDSGLAHLLSISGLHVSAVVAAGYVLALKLLALWPWLALRVRLPLVAAGAGAATGIGYTLLTGAEVPTIRSCIGAVLVLGALAMGREALSMRMLAVAALFVMLFWPEAIVGPSFQMSFAAAAAIVALHGAAPVRAFLAPREESWIARALRNAAMLLATGVVIELALMPIGLFHFHRAGVYGAVANVIAIPLTTLVTMPLIALALLLDMAGLGAPAWWLAGKSLDLMLALAHWVASRPGAVTVLPAMGRGSIALFTFGGLWLALWRGRIRLLGLVPVLIGTALLATLRPPEMLISGDGRHVGITADDGSGLLVLRQGRGSFAAETLSEMAGMRGPTRAIADVPSARCNPDFCALDIRRGGRVWRLLMARGRDHVPERALAAACDRADIVVSDRWLPRSCAPRRLKADRRLLARTGGLTVDFTSGRVNTVAQSQGRHGWWRGEAGGSGVIPAPRPRPAAPE